MSRATDMCAFVVFVHENKQKFAESQQEKEAAGQLKQRSEVVFDKQPHREWLTGISMGWDQLSAWIFREGGGVAQTGPLAFSADVNSDGLQMLLRVWCTDNATLGYVSPVLPPYLRIKEGPLEVDSIIRNMYRLDVGKRSITAAEVLCGTHEKTGEKVVLKTGAAIGQEVR